MNEAREYPVVVYNDAGLETYREEANGHWVKREYDEQGRQVYWETHWGGWARHKFDDAGNEISYENSDGFWFNAEYSENGFRTYYEDSKGTVYGRRSVSSLVEEAKERSKKHGSSYDGITQDKGV